MDVMDSAYEIASQMSENYINSYELTTIQSSVSELQRSLDLLMGEQLIQPYDGNILHWRMFWTTFQDVVMNIPRMIDVTRFRILYNNLDPQTQTLISNLDPANPNLGEVCKRIEEYFDNPNNILKGIANVIEKLSILKNCYSNEQWAALINTANQTKVLLLVNQFWSIADFLDACCRILSGFSPTRSLD